MCGCGIVVDFAAKIAPVRRAVSSSSLLFINPVGLASDTNEFCVSSEKGARHRKCCKVLVAGLRETQKPPIPDLDASVAAKMSGGRGTKVCMGTGWWWACCSTCSQSCSTAFSSGRRRIRCEGVDTKAC